MASSGRPLARLYELGQSPWYDNIERRLFDSGEFKKLIDHYGITGVTSNPSIFEKAISSSDEYDDQIQELLAKGKTAREVYDELAIKDVSSAADELKKIYDKTGGVDGYVSIEVLPEYAHDAQKTVGHARQIHRRINKPNIMIKVPGTAEGIPAIRELISEGININATLLFSMRQYEAVATAYIQGLQDRLKQGKDIKNIVSVASVFVSRIDTKIDKMLEASPAAGELKGKTAVAYMKMIYKRYMEIFSSRDFKALAAEGGRVQRLLWASTSTKNPAYRDVKYVEELIGPRSINTMPHETVMAFDDHGIVKETVTQGLDAAQKALEGLKAAGIDIEEVCQNLQAEGVAKFQESFDLLASSIDRKIEKLTA